MTQSTDIKTTATSALPSSIGSAFDPIEMQIDFLREHKRELVLYGSGKVKYSGKPVRRKGLNELIDNAVKSAAHHGDVVTLTLTIQPPSFRQNSVVSVSCGDEKI